MNRLPQPKFLGALVQFFNKESNSSNGPDAVSDKSQPIIFGSAIEYIRDSFPDRFEHMFEAYFYATAIVLTSAVHVILMHPYLQSQVHFGAKLRIAMCSVIYRKSLRLSKNALCKITEGHIINLISNDVARWDSSMVYIHYLVIGPIMTIIVAYLMFLEVRFTHSFNYFSNFLFMQFLLLDWDISYNWRRIYVTTSTIGTLFGQKNIYFTLKNSTTHR